jgi:VIT1/CCC1 family predicted Fe2+/Mn2+ transporter
MPQSQVSQLNRLNTPQKSQLSGLKGWLNGSRNGFLKDEENQTWHDETESLYLCLATDLRETDAFTETMQNIIVGPYHRLIGHRLKTGKVIDSEAGGVSYDKRKIDGASTMIATILSTMFPVLTIFVLNVLQSTNARIGLTALFTLVFALVLVRFSSAKRVEIFAATST